MEDRLKCEECGKTIDNYWGYLSDFYPEQCPPRDKSNDQVLWVVEVMKTKQRYHYFCSEEHGNIWAERQPYKLITSEVLDA